jgi:hypothetical protein
MVSEEVASSQQLSRKVDVTTVLEESIIVKTKWMIKLCKNDLFVLNVIDMLALNDLSFLH